MDRANGCKSTIFSRQRGCETAREFMLKYYDFQQFLGGALIACSGNISRPQSGLKIPRAEPSLKSHETSQLELILSRAKLELISTW